MNNKELTDELLNMAVLGYGKTFLYADLTPKYTKAEVKNCLKELQNEKIVSYGRLNENYFTLILTRGKGVKFYNDRFNSDL